MQRSILKLVSGLGALVLCSHAQLANAQSATAMPVATSPVVPKLTTVNANQATATYSNSCSNGANADPENRAAFIAALLANPKSKLGIAQQKLLGKVQKANNDGTPETIVSTSDLVVTYHARPDGCGVTLLTLVGFLNYSIPGDDRATVARFQFVIDDIVNGSKRTLTMRSVTPVKFTAPTLQSK